MYIVSWKIWAKFFLFFFKVQCSIIYDHFEMSTDCIIFNIQEKHFWNFLDFFLQFTPLFKVQCEIVSQVENVNQGAASDCHMQFTMPNTSTICVSHVGLPHCKSFPPKKLQVSKWDTGNQKNCKTITLHVFNIFL